MRGITEGEGKKLHIPIIYACFCKSNEVKRGAHMHILVRMCKNLCLYKHGEVKSVCSLDIFRGS